MNDYVIIPDTSCDLTADLRTRFDIPDYLRGVVTYPDGHSEHVSLDWENITPTEFYESMKDKKSLYKTGAVNPDEAREIFEKYLSQGQDILSISLSSALSSTYNVCLQAAKQALEKYPERKIIAIDTLCASAGEGLFVKLVLDKKNEGATIEEAADFANALIPKLAHWFTVEDLVYLKRGGRVSPAVALVGGMLNIKPVMHVDDEGHLIKVGTVRGRKQSLNILADKLMETAEDPANGTIFISHGDCEEDARYLADTIKSKGGNNVEVITNVGTVIGAHSGPGTMALFFVAKQR